MKDTDLWAESIIKSVREIENSHENEDRYDFNFAQTRYSDAYAEALLASVY